MPDLIEEVGLLLDRHQREYEGQFVSSPALPPWPQELGGWQEPDLHGRGMAIGSPPPRNGFKNRGTPLHLDSSPSSGSGGIPLPDRDSNILLPRGGVRLRAGSGSTRARWNQSHRQAEKSMGNSQPGRGPYRPGPKGNSFEHLRPAPHDVKSYGLDLEPLGNAESTRHTQRNFHAAGTIGFSHAPLVVQGISLLSVNILPDQFRGIFPYGLFNAVQSKCFPLVYESSDNIVLSSPTGSGKTAVMELAICHLVNRLSPGTYKVVYQAPTKALCAERKKDWTKKFSTVGLTCTELTGDTQQAQLRNVKNGDIIITTPEKWDSMTRRWEDHKRLVEMIRLFLIDEVHILNEARGATLEVVVSRMKSMGSDVRFVALSATVPNSTDIAEWLGKNSIMQDTAAQEQRFGEEFRPVKLQKFVYGYQYPGNDFLFDKRLDKMLLDVIQKHSAKKPFMVFCMTRAMCVSTAKALSQQWSASRKEERLWPSSGTRFSFTDKDLQEYSACGVAFHHAGLDAKDRMMVERLFLEGSLSVICCTSTLAVGVNLPTYLVIVKNTVTWSNGSPKECADLEIMQMLGRAGRPQFDDAGVAVIMTKKENQRRYEKMVSGEKILESCLHENLVEHMNAEIGLGTITDVESAKRWLKSTFLYVRLKKNPAHYRIAGGSTFSGIEGKLGEICGKSIHILDQEGLLQSSEGRLECSEFGKAMARYYVKFETVKKILTLQERATVPEVLETLSQAEEFKDLKFRIGERGLYKELNNSAGMKYPIKGDISTYSHKVFLLVQLEIGMVELPNEEKYQKYRTTLLLDKVVVFNHCHRIIRCIIDCKLHTKDAVAAKAALEVARSLTGKAWENSPGQLRQIEGLGPVAIKKLVNTGVRSLDMLVDIEPHKIEMALSRNPPFGKNVVKMAREIPRLRVISYQLSKVANRKDPVKLKVRAELGFLNDQKPEIYRGRLLFANFLAERSDGLLIQFLKIQMSKLEGGKNAIFTVDLETPDQTILCHLVCEELVGTLKTHELKPDVDISLYPPRPSVALPPKPAPASFASPGKGPILGRMGALKASSFPGVEEFEMYDDPEFIAAIEDLDFAHIDNFDERAAEQTNINTAANSGTKTFNSSGNNGTSLAEESVEQVKQLPNGKWECRHKCGDKSKCKHLCCREGLDNPSKPKKSTASAPPTKGDTLARHGEKLGALPQYKVGAACLVGPSGYREIEVVDLITEASQPGHSQHAGFPTHLNNFRPASSTSGTKAAKGMAPSLGLDQELPELTSVGTREERRANEGYGNLVASLFHEKKVQDRAEKTPRSASSAYGGVCLGIAASEPVAIKSQGRDSLANNRPSHQRFNAKSIFDNYSRKTPDEWRAQSGPRTAQRDLAAPTNSPYNLSSIVIGGPPSILRETATRSAGDEWDTARTCQKPVMPPAAAPAARETASKQAIEDPRTPLLSLHKEPDSPAPEGDSALFDSGEEPGKKRKIERIWGKKVEPTWHRDESGKKPKVISKPIEWGGGRSVADTTLDFLWDCVEYSH